MQSKSRKKSRSRTTKRRMDLLLVATTIVVVLTTIIALLTVLLVLNKKTNITKINRHKFTKTEFIGESYGSYYCSDVNLKGKPYCVEGWTKIYDAMDENSNQLSSTMGKSITIEFEASYRIGEKEYTDQIGRQSKKILPTIFINKVYSASAAQVDF